MTNRSSVSSQITLQGINLSEVGFGNLVFITAHRAYQDRVRAYTSETAVGADHGTDSAAYRFANTVFSQEPSVKQIRIGRRNAELNLTPVNIQDTEVHSFSITVGTTTKTFSFTAGPATTASDVVTALMNAINTDTDVNTEVSATNATATVLKLSGQNDNSWFTTSNFATGKFTGQDEWVGTESAANVITNITEEDDDFYCVTADDASQAFQLAMATVVQAMDKVYFTATAATDEITTAYSQGDDLTTGGQLKDLGRTRTVMFFHQSAANNSSISESNYIYPEAGYFGVNAPHDAGSTNWANVAIKGVGISQNPATGNVLSTTHKNRLIDRNINFVDVEQGAPLVKPGKTSQGEWIDTIRGADWLNYEIQTEVRQMLLAQQGGKLPFTNDGGALVYGAIKTALQRGVDRGFLRDGSIIINVPDISEVSAQDFTNRVLDGVTWSAIIANAITYIDIAGTLSTNGQ